MVLCSQVLQLLFLLRLRAVAGDSTTGGKLRYSYDIVELEFDREGLLGSFFGTAVAVSSKYMMVGSIGDGVAPYKRSGSVYVYSRKWKFVEKLTPSERGSNYQFGSSLALSDATSAVVIGSPYARMSADGSGASINCGVAHVFEVDKSVGLHTEVAQLVPHDGMQYDEFGKAVAIYRDTIAVSSVQHSLGRGAVYMYQKEGITWVNSSVLKVDMDSVMYLGHSISIHENSIALSALHGNDGGERSSVFIFERQTESSAWALRRQLLPSVGSPGDEYGISVSLVNGMLAVGSRYASLAQEKAGAVYIYEKDDGSDWSESALLTATVAQPMGFFGDTVVLGETFIAVGSFGWKGSDSTDIVGAVYIFSQAHGSWSEKTILVSSHGSNNDFFSKALSVHGDVVVVGAAGDDLNTMNSGSVFHFDLLSSYHSNSDPLDGEGDLSSHSFVISFVAIFVVCCCFGMGCCPGKKFRRLCCKDYCGLSLGKKKSSKRKRHIRDINDIQHSPLKLDDSLRGYDCCQSGDVESPLDDDEDGYEMTGQPQYYDGVLDPSDQNFDNNVVQKTNPSAAEPATATLSILSETFVKPAIILEDNSDAHHTDNMLIIPASSPTDDCDSLFI